MLDIYAKNPLFSLTSLTKSVNEMPFVPGQAGKLGLFEEAGVHTTTIEIENYNGTLVLIPTSKRGGPAHQNKRDSRKVRHFVVPHLALADQIFAEEIQNKRKFGSDSELETAQDEMNRRLARMLKSHDATIEYGRIGAIKGVIYDADGATVIYDLFSEFGVAKPTLDYVLGTAGTDILSKSTEVRGKIQDALGQDGDDNLEVGCFCGATWFQKFISHSKVAEAYKYYQTVQQQLNPLQQDLRYKGFKFGGITYWQYRGSVSGVAFVDPAKAHAFPMNVPDVFITRFAPADYMETANTEGLPRYAKQAPDPMWNKFVEAETQSNPISLCTRPGALVELTTSN